MHTWGNSTCHAYNAPCRSTEVSVIQIQSRYKLPNNQNPHSYRKNDPTSIQEKRSDMYTERSIPPLLREKQIPHVYRRKLDPTCIQEGFDPTSIQKQPSWALNEVTIDWSSEITTEACRQSWVLVRAINPRCCLQTVDIDGFLLKFGVFFFFAVNVLSEVCWQHLTGRIQHYQTCFSFNEWGVRGVLLFFLSKPS